MLDKLSELISYFQWKIKYPEINAKIKYEMATMQDHRSEIMDLNKKPDSVINFTTWLSGPWT